VGKINNRSLKKLSKCNLLAALKNNIRKKRILSYLRLKRAFKVKILKSLKNSRKNSKRLQLRIQK